MFYQICFVAFLWASFLLYQGVLLWVSVVLVLVAGGIGLFGYLLHVDHIEGKIGIEEGLFL